MESLCEKNFLKQLSQEVDNLRKENAEKSAELSFISLQNDFLQKNVQWLQIFLELAEKKDAKRTELADSFSENQFLFSEFVCKIFDKGLINNVRKNDQPTHMQPLIKIMDELIGDTESILNFYNDIPIVQTYQALNSAYQESEIILRSWKEKKSILKEDIQHFNLLFNERNRIIVNLVKNSRKIAQFPTEIERMTNESIELEHKNEVLKQFNKKIEYLENKKEEFENINKVTSKFTLRHIDIFKIPSFPAKVLKSSGVQTKCNEKENKRSIKKSITTLPTFPILPLHRNSSHHTIDDVVCAPKLQKSTNFQIIENVQVNPGEFKYGKLDETIYFESRHLAAMQITDSVIRSTENSNINANNKLDSVNTHSKNKIDENSKAKQKSMDSSAEEKIDLDEQTTKSGLITLCSFKDKEERQIKVPKFTYTKWQSEIPIEKNIDLKNTSDVTAKLLTTQNVVSKVGQIDSPKKRFQSDLDSLPKKKRVHNENKETLPSKYSKVKIPDRKTEKAKGKQQTKHDKFKIDFASISLDDMGNSAKSQEECEFNFDDGNMNFDEIGNNLFDSGGDLDFSSDNQFGADCESFKF